MTNSTENVAKNVANEKVQDYVKKSHNVKENEPKSEKTTQDVQKNCSSLTEKWKNGELPNGRYYIETIPCEPCDVLGIPKYTDYYCIDSKFSYNITVKEVLAPVPSYEEWQDLNELVDCMSDTGKAFAHMLSPFTDDYFNGLTTKDIAELAKKSIRLTTQHCEDNAEIDKLKELLKECSPYVSRSATSRMIKNSVGHKKDMKLLTQIDEALK